MAAPPAAAPRPTPTRRGRPRTPSAASARRASGCDRGRGSRSMPALETPLHFLTGAELDAATLAALLDRAAELKAAPLSSRVLAGRTIALMFQKPSTRTRSSFETGVFELGGHPMIVRANELQLTRGESVRDTALVFSRHVAAIGLRTGSEDELHELARYATVPVINMLSPLHHPCQ